MVIGYLHLGPPAHGVCRYGRMLAEEAKRRSDLIILEQAAIVSNECERDTQALREAARQLSTAEVVHLQFTEAIWGTDAHRFRNLRTFLRHCHAPVVVTIHDTEPAPPQAEFQPTNGLRQRLRVLRRQIRRWLHLAGIAPNYLAAHHDIRHWLMAQTAFSFVCTAEEERRLNAPHLRHKIRRIPHFVEERPSLPTRAEARAALGFDAEIVITILGFIYGGKGYEILLDAAAQLARPDMLVVFAGGAIPGNEAYLYALQARARSLGIERQLRITGYLSEDEFERYLVATDIPVCPYEICYASGALSNWLSAKRSVLTSNLAQFTEYQLLDSKALWIFSPYTSNALTFSIKEWLSSGLMNATTSRADKLAEQLSIRHIVNKHIDCYDDVCRMPSLSCPKL